MRHLIGPFDFSNFRLPATSFNDLAETNAQILKALTPGLQLAKHLETMQLPKLPVVEFPKVDLLAKQLTESIPKLPVVELPRFNLHSKPLADLALASARISKLFEPSAQTLKRIEALSASVCPPKDWAAVAINLDEPWSKLEATVRTWHLRTFPLLEHAARIAEEIARRFEPILRIGELLDPRRIARSAIEAAAAASARRDARPILELAEFLGVEKDGVSFLFEVLREQRWRQARDPVAYLRQAVRFAKRKYLRGDDGPTWLELAVPTEEDLDRSADSSLLWRRALSAEDLIDSRRLAEALLPVLSLETREYVRRTLQGETEQDFLESGWTQKQFARAKKQYQRARSKLRVH